MEEETQVRLPEKLGFMAFSTSQNIVYNFKSLYYLIFLTNVLKIDVLVAGTMLTMGIIWDAFNDPLIGIWSANHTFKNGEKVRPFALYCSIPWAVTIVLLFSDFHTTQTLSVIIGLAVYFVFEALNTFLGMPYNSMGSLASHVDADRRSINSFRSLGGCLGSGIGAVAVTPLVKLFGGLKGKGAIIGSSDAPALFKTACLMGVICIAGALTHYFTTRERVRQIEDNEEKISLIKGYRMLFRCRSCVLNMFYVICYGINNTLIMTSINYYAAYIMGSSSAATPILAVYLVVAIVVSLVTPSVDRRIGRKRMKLLGAAVLIAGKIPFILNPYSVANVYINAFTVGIGSTVAFIMFNTNRNNIADIVEWQNGRRIDSLVASGDNLAAKLAEAGTTQLMAMALSAAGFSESLKQAQTPETIKTITSFIGWVPFAVSVVMFAVLMAMDIEKEMRSSRDAYRGPAAE
ncbi:MAG: MFS transporter [Eubacteriaceae bacterium]|nr:MFS transporter [Eubacteriaceae bacterium]